MTETKLIYDALAAIIRATKPDISSWIVGGSAGLMLRGLPLTAEPRDLDIYCDEEDVFPVYEALKQYAVDVPALSITGMYRSTLCHFRIEGVWVEVVGGFQVAAAGCRYVTAVRELLIPFGDVIPLEDSPDAVAVVPLAHELWFNLLRERADRVELIAEAFAADPDRHEGALQAIEAGNSFTCDAKSVIRRILTRGKAGGDV
ncbi:hypothetical protein [Paenibacillus harenae]|uniref:hypothetical protein n=1 Tax=Paenibacillus harenae TaxID=306543 RepID=UPI000683ECA7|nr:hypothetical protein [Paenibacillus harenae]